MLYSQGPAQDLFIWLLHKYWMNKWTQNWKAVNSQVIMDKLLNLFNILIFKLYTIHPVTFKRRWTTMKCFVNYWMVRQLFLLRNDWQYISRIWRNFRNVTIWNRSGEVSEWDHDLLSETAPLFEWMWPWKSSLRPAGAWDNSLRTHTWRRTAEIFAIELGQIWGHGYCQHRLWARGLELGEKKRDQKICLCISSRGWKGRVSNE